MEVSSLILMLVLIMRSSARKVAEKINTHVKLKNAASRLAIIFFSNCTRKCLIDQDTWACAKLSGTARDSCRKRAHYFCYSACFNSPDAIGGGFGTLPPPACKGAADAIGGMW